jgi:hypothetical protein
MSTPEHPIWEHLAAVREAVGKIPEELRQKARETEDVDADILDRLPVVVEQVNAIVTGTEWHLVSTPMLTALDNQLTQLQGHLTSLVTEEDPAYLETIETSLDATLDALATWGSAPALKAPEIRRLADALGQASQERLAELEARAKEIRAALEEISTASTAAVEKIQETADEQTAAVSQEQARLAAEISTQTTAITQALATQAQEFEAAEKKRKEDFADLVDELEAQATKRAEEQKVADEAALAALRGEMTALREETAAEAAEIIDRLAKREQEAAALVDLVATSSTAGAYGKEAEEQKTVADNWRGWVLKIGALAAGFAVFSVVYTIREGFELEEFLPKLVLTVLIAGLAGYAGKQSADHRRREMRAKRLELELLAFGPFTEKLTTEQAQVARIAFMERAFVGDQGPEQKGAAPDQASSGTGPASLIAELMRGLLPGGGEKPPPA